MKFLTLTLSALVSLSSFASQGKVVKTIPIEVVNVLWQNGASLMDPAQVLFDESIHEENSELVKAIKKVYEENAEQYAQPIFPNSFLNTKLSDSITYFEATDAGSYTSRHVLPLKAAVSQKATSVIAWLIIDISGLIDGPATIALSVQETL